MIRLIVLVILITTQLQARTWNKIQNDALIVGISKDVAPFGKMSEGSLKGIEYELAGLIARELKIKFRPHFIESMRQGKALLKKDKIDVIISTLHTDSDPSLAYSMPYYRTGQDILVSRENNSIYTASDLNGQLVAAMAGSSGLSFLEIFIPNSKPEVATSTEDALQMIADKEVVAYINDRVILDHIVRTNKKVRVLSLALTEDSYSVGVKKGNKKLMSKINYALKRVLGGKAGKKSNFATVLAKYNVPNTVTTSNAGGNANPNSHSTSGVNSHSNGKSSSGSGDNLNKKKKIDDLIRQIDRIKMELKSLRDEL